MAELGYTLSSEEHGPRELVRYARLAEEAGFPYALISDHFHPWTDAQGESPFVWCVLGGIAQATERLQLGTGVTCPTMRIHPVIVAQAAATAAAMLPGRFFLGVGTGENLNEHVLGDRWPSFAERREMLEEAVALMRELWQGRLVSHAGPHYLVDRARIYTLPEEPPPVYVAAAGPEAAELAGRIGDGLISTAPEAALVETFERTGGRGKPRYGQLHVCFAEDEAAALRTAYELWPNVALRGPLGQKLAVPSHFEDVAEMVSGRRRRARPLRPGPRSPPRADPEVRRRRLRPRLRAPDRARPGGLLPLLLRGDPAAALTRPAAGGRGPRLGFRRLGFVSVSSRLRAPRAGRFAVAWGRPRHPGARPGVGRSFARSPVRSGRGRPGGRKPPTF